MTQRVTWADEASEHMLSGHGVTVAQATEALADPDAITFDPDPSSKSGETVRVVGYCASRNEVVTVILLHDGGDCLGINGWITKSGRDRSAYNAQQ